MFDFVIAHPISFFRNQIRHCTDHFSQNVFNFVRSLLPMYNVMINFVIVHSISLFSIQIRPKTWKAVLDTLFHDPFIIILCKFEFNVYVCFVSRKIHAILVNCLYILNCFCNRNNN